MAQHPFAQPRRLWASALLTVASGCAGARLESAPPLPDRWQFAAAMEQLEQGDPVSRVIELLGLPDDVVDPREQDDEFRGSVLWCYGTHGHRSFPTLGTIQIDANSQVGYLASDNPCKWPRGLLTEAELRRLMHVMHDTARLGFGAPPHPQAVVTLVNALVDVGEPAAVAAMLEFCRVADWHYDDSIQSVAFAARCAFEIPADPGYLPDGGFGAPNTMPANDRASTPRFPMHTVLDTPFYLAGPYRVGGEADCAGSILDIADAADLRTEHLQPEAPGTTLNALFDELAAIDATEKRPADERFTGSFHTHAISAWRAAGADEAMIERVERHLVGQPTAPEHTATIGRLLDGLSPERRADLVASVEANAYW